MRRFLLHLLFAASGATGLVYQVVWVRQFARVFGSGVHSAAAVTAIFLGGWSLPWLSQQTIVSGVGSVFGTGFATILCMGLHVACFFAKLAFVVWLQMLIRWSMPRFRYDQVMDLCWKVILPLSVLNVFVTAGFMLAAGQVGDIAQIGGAGG